MSDEQGALVFFYKEICNTLSMLSFAVSWKRYISIQKRLTNLQKYRQKQAEEFGNFTIYYHEILERFHLKMAKNAIEIWTTRFVDCSDWLAKFCPIRSCFGNIWRTVKPVFEPK